MMLSLCLMATLLEPAADPVPPPLTDEQIAKVRLLVKTHQEEQQRLRGQLEKAQQKLAGCYAEYKLDEAEVEKLQAEILEVQGKLLRGYHTLQKELRSIVGPERFAILSRRIDNAIRNPPDPKK